MRVAMLSFILLVVSPLLLCAQDDSVPHITDDGTVIFPSTGRTLSVTTERQRLQSGEEIDRSEPVYLEEEPRIVRSWHRVVVVRRFAHYEGEEVQVSFFTFEGERVGTSERYFGEFNVHFLIPTKRVVVGQITPHFDLSESYILDTNGEVVTTLDNRSTTTRSGASDDGRIVWFISSESRSLKKGEEPVHDLFPSTTKPVNVISVYDYNGRLLMREELDNEQPTDWEVEIDGRVYRIPVPEASPAHCVNVDDAST